jgi:hypothetical protein
VKTWRNASEFVPIVWSADSQSFYFARSIAMTMVGLEIMKVTLKPGD